MWTITSGGCENKDSLEIELNTPQDNDVCSQADSLTILQPNSGRDSLCAATADISEPSTCGRAACNSLIYKFRTKPFATSLPLDISFTEISTCTDGLRVSIFNDGACPSLGSQFGSCETISSTSDTIKFRGLSPNTVYYIVIDDNSPGPCGTSTCVYDFTLSNDALPVEFIGFNVELFENKIAALTWNTASEENNSHFEVLRRLPYETEFQQIGEVQGHGNSTAIQEYNFMDDLSLVRSGDVFYKIKQVDFDGRSEETKIRKVRIEANPSIGFTLFPNPTDGILTIQTKKESSELVYEVQNTIGKKVLSESTKKNNTIDLRHLAPGIYFVSVMDNGILLGTERIVVKGNN